MSAITIERTAPARSLALIVGASSAGTVFEWYDFYIYASVLAIVSKQFFGGVNDTAAYIFALLGFGAAFAARPFGALVFGHMGDRAGRKRTFLITISLMGFATFAIGLLPTYAQGGFLAPTLLIAMRLIQGFAVGGEYGGAVIYVAEHAPAGKRGVYTGWIQTTAAVGLVIALVVVLTTRRALGEDAFAAWGWRIPFLLSLVLLAISLWVRMRLSESPLFQAIRDDRAMSKAPIPESFMRWRNLKIVFTVLFGFQAAHGVIWYSYHFYVPVFLERVLKVDGQTVTQLMLIAIVISLPMYIFWAWLSDRVGRKPLMLTAIGLSAVLFFPLFHALTEAANPALAQAQANAPAAVVADDATCSLQFDPIGAQQFVSSCDIAKSALAGAGVNYRNLAGPQASVAVVRIGNTQIPSIEGRGLPKAELDKAKAAFAARLSASLAAAGYPAKADPARVDKVRVIGILLIWMVLATMLYGPLAAALVELFPTRIRYTALSLPYHIGTGWFGGFLPAIAVTTIAETGNIYSGLWFPVAVAGCALVIGTIFLPETRNRDIAKL